MITQALCGVVCEQGREAEERVSKCGATTGRGDGVSSVFDSLSLGRFELGAHPEPILSSFNTTRQVKINLSHRYSVLARLYLCAQIAPPASSSSAPELPANVTLVAGPFIPDPTADRSLVNRHLVLPTAPVPSHHRPTPTLALVRVQPAAPSSPVLLEPVHPLSAPDDKGPLPL